MAYAVGAPAAGSFTASATHTCTTTVAAGELVVVCLNWNDATSTIVSVVDNASPPNTYSIAATAVNLGGSTSSIYYSFIATSQVSATITATLSASVAGAIGASRCTGFVAFETAAGVYMNGTGAQTTDGVTTGNITFSSAPAVMFGFSRTETAGFVAGTGFTSAGNPLSGGAIGMLEYSTTAVLTTTPAPVTFTMANGPTHIALVGAVFSLPGGGSKPGGWMKYLLTLGAFGFAGAMLAPVYSSGVNGLGVLLGQPIVGSSIGVLDGILSQPGSPGPSTSYQWYRGDSQLVADPGTAISGATSSTYTPTLADTMKVIWCVITHTNLAGSASCATWKTRCIPSGSTIGQGFTADSGQVNDPSVASPYSATTLYQCGDVVTFSAANYIMMQPYSYGIAPTDPTWKVISASLYFDADSGNDSTGTGSKAAPYKTVSKMLDLFYASSVPTDTVLLLKRGTTNAYTGSVRTHVSGPCFGAYGVGARPKWNYVAPTQTQVNTGGYPTNSVEFNFTNNNALVCNIDFDGARSIIVPVTTASIVNGPFVASDVVTFANGMSGTVTATFTVGTYTALVLTMGTVTNANFSAGGTVTSGIKSGTTFANIIAVGGAWGFSNTNYNYGVAHCSFQNMGNGAFSPDSAIDQTKGDCFIVDCYVNQTCVCLNQGSGIGGGPAARVRAWFNTVQDSGYADCNFNHQIYFAFLTDSSILFNNVVMTANYGNQSFNMHQNSDTVELAYNIFKGSRSGIGINDGDADGEKMYRWNVHHNLTRDIGTGSGQSGGSLSWFISCLQNSRIYCNLTIDTSLGDWVDERTHGVGNTQLGNTVVAQNSFWNSAQIFGSGVDGTNLALVTNLTVQNNILATNAANTLLTMGYTMPIGQLTQNNDLFFRSGGGTVVTWSFGSSPANYTTAALLHAGVPTVEGSGVTGDPLFVSTTAGSENLALQGGSPAKLAGVDLRRALGYAADYAFTLRSATTPSIGAYE